MIVGIIGLVNFTLLSAPATEKTANQLIVFQSSLTGYDWMFIGGTIAVVFAIGLIFYRRLSYAFFVSTFTFGLIGMASFIAPVLAVGEAKEWVAGETNINRFDISDTAIFTESGSTATLQNDAGQLFTLFIEEGKYNNQNVIIYRLSEPVER